jgi:type VI secretion system protein
MIRRALLSRIAGPDASPVDELQSILAHLRALLNSRQGDSPCAPRYGVVEFVDVALGFPAALPELAKSIRSTILEFEPRLKNVTVHQQPQDDPLVLRFEIAAQLARRGAAGSLQFTTTILPGGRIEIAG